MNPQTEVIVSILAYSLCSGTLVLLNKLILFHLNYPSLVTSLQLAFTLLFIYGAKHFLSMPVDEIQWKYVVPYLSYTVAFSMGVYCNMKSLSISNVETVIVFRALAPCVVAILDAIFLGRNYPNSRSWCALGLIVLGTLGYASFDEKFQTQGWSAYGWPFCYLLLISFEMAYGKQIIGSVELKTHSGPVLYTNLLGIFPMLFFAYLGNEPNRFVVDRSEGKPIPFAGLFFLCLGCVAGTGIGYSSWWCRDKVSATSFSLIGVVNKCLTVILNLFIWDKHAPPGGIASLGLCLLGGMLYQQAPMRLAVPSKAATSASIAGDAWESTDPIGDDEEELLVSPSGMKQRK